MKRIMISVFIFALIFNCISCSSDKFNNIENNNHNDTEVIDKTREEANSIYEKLIQSFKPTTLLKNTEAVDIKYPDYYGGAYINNDGKLVICEKTGFTKSVTSNSILNKAIEKIEIKQVKYSYNELLDVMTVINSSVFSENSNDILKNNITHAGIDDEKNRVCIYMLDDSQLKRKEFKSLVINSDKVEFLKSNGVIIQEANTNAGKSYFTSSGTGSVGDIGL